MLLLLGTLMHFVVVLLKHGLSLCQYLSEYDTENRMKYTGAEIILSKYSEKNIQKKLLYLDSTV